MLVELVAGGHLLGREGAAGTELAHQMAGGFPHRASPEEFELIGGCRQPEADQGVALGLAAHGQEGPGLKRQIHNKRQKAGTNSTDANGRQIHARRVPG